MREILEYKKPWQEIKEGEWPKEVGTICLIPIKHSHTLVFQWQDSKIEGIRHLAEFWRIEDARDFAKMKNDATQPPKDQVEVIDCYGSSNINSVTYFLDDQSMAVTFKNYSRYLYKDVPYEVFTGMGEAKSRGAYLNSEVKGKYRYEKLT